ncbi:MoaD/ThiS family protein [Desulfobacula phenolica]|uniref:ThiS family protein n=1 Tax=Desulfobacula phenolica TaxID=90732 RepID=A0A1H2J3H2_9BACT|nr:MoaD/ThiS family protein [Desulfobacula phenolica]SDU50940.1 ThiS family protein [Desulfobacula phenolica]
MEITVNTPITHLRPDLRNATVEVAEGKTLREFMKDVSLSDYSIEYVLINKKKAEMTQQLKSGDDLFFIPMMAGG